MALNPEIWKCGNTEIRKFLTLFPIFPNHEIQKSGNPEVSGTIPDSRPNVPEESGIVSKTSGFPDFRISGLLEFRISKFKDAQSFPDLDNLD